MLAKIMTMWLLEPICSKAPRIMIPEIALVTAINGVCNAWVTFQTTCHPMKQANTKTARSEEMAVFAVSVVSVSFS